jgi:hypothetical protein
MTNDEIWKESEQLDQDLHIMKQVNDRINAHRKDNGNPEPVGEVVKSVSLQFGPGVSPEKTCGLCENGFVVYNISVNGFIREVAARCLCDLGRAQCQSVPYFDETENCPVELRAAGSRMRKLRKELENEH